MDECSNCIGTMLQRSFGKGVSSLVVRRQLTKLTALACCLRASEPKLLAFVFCVRCDDVADISYYSDRSKPSRLF